jgi:hypothetical protein
MLEITAESSMHMSSRYNVALTGSGKLLLEYHIRSLAPQAFYFADFERFVGLSKLSSLIA